MKKLFLHSIFFLLCIQAVNAQKDHSLYFEIAAEDHHRWSTYDELISSNITKKVKADSLYILAQFEYEQKQFSKCVELCELAQSFDKSLSKTHLLIGKAYVSSSSICEVNNMISFKEEIIWIAIDEWNKIPENSPYFVEAKKLISSYSSYLPLKEKFQSCYGNNNLRSGDVYFVDCWINKYTKIKFRSKK